MIYSRSLLLSVLIFYSADVVAAESKKQPQDLEQWLRDNAQFHWVGVSDLGDPEPDELESEFKRLDRGRKEKLVEQLALAQKRKSISETSRLRAKELHDQWSTKLKTEPEVEVVVQK